MKIFFDFINSLIDKLKQLRINEMLAAVPAELKTQFDQEQLKNSLYRLKIFGIITIVFNYLNYPFYFIRASEISLAQFQKIFISDFSQFVLTFLFIVLTSHFSKKNKSSTLWIMCYSYIILLFLSSFYSMISAEVFLILQLYFTCAFLYTFIPDFKPYIFITFLSLWYLAITALLLHHSQSFEIGGAQIFALNIFLIAFVIKIFHYNGKVRTFINTHKISALNEKLETLSITDELTKLNNRRSFLEYMDTIWVLSRRLMTPLNVLMIDVDYFKKYNDSMGHLEGDKALIAIAKCMKEQIKRDTDFVARFGGEEFVCLIPFLEKDDALNLAKKLVQRIENMAIPHPMSEVSKYVTISAGMANVIPDENTTQTQLLDEADKALYAAKQSGRNRVVTI